MSITHDKHLESSKQPLGDQSKILEQRDASKREDTAFSSRSDKSARSLARKKTMEEELAAYRERQAVLARQEEEDFTNRLLERFALEEARSVAGEPINNPAAALPAVQADQGILQRRLGDLKTESDLVARILKNNFPETSPSGPGIAKISSKLKITPPKEWEGDFDFVKRETWIRAARGYLNGVGLKDLDEIDESLDALPLHTVRMLFSNKETNGLSPQAWFNARHEREPFSNLSQIFEAVREYWTDDHAAEVAYDKYRSTRQGSLRGREFGALVEVLANGCFDRKIDENDRISTYERGLNSNYRDFLKTQISLLTQLGRAPSTLAEYVKIAAVADGLAQFSSTLKKSTSSGTTGSTSSQHSSTHKRSDRFASSTSRFSHSTSSGSTPASQESTAKSWVSQAIEWQTRFPLAAQAEWSSTSNKPAPAAIRCFNCGARGEHFSRCCPNARKDPRSVTIAAWTQLSPASSSPPILNPVEEETITTSSGNVNGE